MRTAHDIADKHENFIDAAGKRNWLLSEAMDAL